MELKGSYTIEASLLMPLILGTIVIILYMSFFLHDRAVITEGTIILANHYTNEKKLSNSQIRNNIKEESNQVIKQKTIVTRDIKIKIDVADKNISVTCNGNFYFPSMYIVSTIWGHKNYSISATKSIKRDDPVQVIRTCRIVEEFLR